jgi:NDP-sugar pyrophosphorylase family protein
MNAMILAAGTGTRLHPMTETLAKPMVPIGGRPVLEHTVRWLRDHGIRRVAVNLHHRPESVSGHFGDGSRFDVEIRYSEEPELLGTAGGVKRLESFFEDPFLVVYGDVLTDLDLGAFVTFHRSVGTAVHATLAVDRRPDVAQGGVVVLDADNRIRRFVEKPRPGEIRSSWVNSGVMVLDRALLARIPAGRFSDFGREVLPQWLSDGVPVYGWPLPAGTFLADVGTPESYARADREWRPVGGFRPAVDASLGGQEA